MDHRVRLSAESVVFFAPPALGAARSLPKEEGEEQEEVGGVKAGRGSGLAARSRERRSE